MTKFLVSALTLALSASAFAAEPVEAPTADAAPAEATSAAGASTGTSLAEGQCRNEKFSHGKSF